MKHSRLAVFFCMILLASSLAAGEIGYITEATEGAQLIRGDTVFSLEEGVALDSEDVINTGAGGHAQMEMQDGSVFEVGSSSQVHLSEYQLNDRKQVEKAEISLVAGWLRFITAKLNQPRYYRFTTPTMTIGIRGTEGTINAEEDISSLSLSEGEVDVSELDEEGNILPPDRLRAGEFVERHQGQRLRLFKQTPASFKNKLPDRFKKRIARKLKRLKKLGVSPKELRKVAFRDVQKIIRNNPRIRDRLIERFKQRFKNPSFRENFRKHMKNNPGLKNKLKRNPMMRKKMKSWAEEKRKNRLREKRKENLYRRRNQ